MAHQITSTDALFSTRMPTWHGMGVIFEDYPSREEAQKIAHPWEPVAEPVYIGEPTLDVLGNLTQEYKQVPGFNAVRRSDNGDTLGVLRDGYEPVKNSELWDIAAALEDSGTDVQYETAGSLQGGRKVWVLLKLKDPVVVHGDPNGATMPYYALQNAHDGSAAFRGQAVMTRIVCANTAQVADMDARAKGTEFSFRHSKNVKERIEEAQQALLGWRTSISEWALLQEHLIDISIDTSQRDDFIEAFFPVPEGQVISDRVRKNVGDARYDFLQLLYGPTCEGIENTAAGLVAAATEYAEHVRKAHSQSTRFNRTFLSKNKLVESATKLALAV